MLLLLTLIYDVVSQNSFGALSITPASSTIQELTDYNFVILLGLVEPVTASSVIYINLPTEYPSTAATSYHC